MPTEYNINSQWTLVERAKLTDPDGKRVGKIIDVMDKRGVEDFMRDVPYFQANQGLRHRVRRTSSRPASTRRNFYQGVPATMQTSQVVYEPCILFEQRSAIDEDELDTLENPKEARRQQLQGHMAGLLEDFVYACFRDARTSGSEYINGLQTRLDTLSYPSHTTETLPFVWNNGGSGSYTCSVYIVEWGPLACHAVYPSGNAVRGSEYGIIYRNKRKESQGDTDNTANIYYAYVDQFKKWAGLVCNDARKVTRICNIARDRTSSTSFSEDILIEALNHGHFNKAASRIYMNPYVKTQIDIRAKDKSNVDWTVKDVFGKPIMTFQGMPIRVLDETILPGTETALS